MTVQGELFPLVSPESVEAMFRQAQAEFREVAPELPKGALLRLMGELSLLRQVVQGLSVKARVTPEYRQRQAVRTLDVPALLAGHFSACQEKPPESTSPTLSLHSSSTVSRNARRLPGGRSFRPKWRRCSTESKPA